MEEQTPPKSKTTVFVGGISWKADEEGLRKYFEEFGTVLECKIIFDRATNKSKGYGFLTFATAEEAQRVKNAKDLSFLGKTMNVGEAYHKNRTDQAVSPMLSPMQMPMDMMYNMDYMAGQAAAYPAYYYGQYGGQYQQYVPYMGMGYYPPGVVSPVGGVQYYDPAAYAQMPMTAVPYYSPEQGVTPNGMPVAAVPAMMLPPAQQAQPYVSEVQPTTGSPRPHAAPAESDVPALEQQLLGLRVADHSVKPGARHLRSSSEGASDRPVRHVGGRTLPASASASTSPIRTSGASNGALSAGEKGAGAGGRSGATGAQ